MKKILEKNLIESLYPNSKIKYMNIRILWSKDMTLLPIIKPSNRTTFDRDNTDPLKLIMSMKTNFKYLNSSLSEDSFLLCNMYPKTTRYLVIQVLIYSNCNTFFVGAFYLIETCHSQRKIKPKLPDIGGSEDTCCIKKSFVAMSTWETQIMDIFADFQNSIFAGRNEVYWD